MTMLTNEQVAKLYTKLSVPIIINDILQKDECIEPDTEYALHEILSDMDPDSALLSIALSARHIAVRFPSNNQTAAATCLEAQCIIEDYGIEWLESRENKKREEDIPYGTLCYISEDLEAMATMLEAMATSLDISEGTTIAICNILAIQANAHKEITDYIIDTIDQNGYGNNNKNRYEENKNSEPETVTTATRQLAPPELTQYETRGDNIILFPFHLRN